MSLEDLNISHEFLLNEQQPRWKRKQESSKEGDRFIPSMENNNIKNYKIIKGDEENSNCNYTKELQKRLFSEELKETKILTLSKKAPKVDLGYENELRVLYSQNKNLKENSDIKKETRVINQTPERILDAPCLVDDYYLNLLDWSTENIIAVALAETVYLWNATNGNIHKLMSTSSEDDYVTSVNWIQDGSYLAVGTNHNMVEIYDVESCKKIRAMNGHSARISSLSWNQHILSSGSKDGSIVNHDVRVKDHDILTLNGHEQEVCGLKWNNEGTHLASGGNDNVLNIWANNKKDAIYKITDHTAAVKALDWCPWQSNLLVSGGGTADRHLRFWNTSTGECLNSIDTKSQVCSVLWAKYDRELVSSHGFSKNQLCVWKYPSLAKIGELTGHTSRVLHMAMSPDGTQVVSAAGDETLRFWKIFNASKKKKNFESSSIRNFNLR
jgi:cell division cycle protein 20 (cofactor of APC complex)